MDFNLSAESYDDNTNESSNSRSNNRFSNYDFDRGEIKVISEPYPNQNYNINRSEKPIVAVEDDKIYVVWEDNTDHNGAGGDYDIFYRYFDGSKWSNIQVISEPVEGKNINTDNSYSPKIVVDNGKIYVVWDDCNNTNGAGIDDDIFYRCNLTGTNWEDVERCFFKLDSEPPAFRPSSTPAL